MALSKDQCAEVVGEILVDSGLTEEGSDFLLLTSLAYNIGFPTFGKPKSNLYVSGRIVDLVEEDKFGKSSVKIFIRLDSLARVLDIPVDVVSKAVVDLYKWTPELRKVIKTGLYTSVEVLQEYGCVIMYPKIQKGKVEDLKKWITGKEEEVMLVMQASLYKDFNGIRVGFAWNLIDVEPFMG